MDLKLKGLSICISADGGGVACSWLCMTITEPTFGLAPGACKSSSVRLPMLLAV